MFLTLTSLRPACRMSPCCEQLLDRRRTVRRAGTWDRSGAAATGRSARRPGSAGSCVACWTRYSGRPSGDPPVRSGARQARLGRDAHVPVRVQRLADEALGDVRAVRVGRVDEVDPQLARPPQRPDRLAAIGRLAPDARTGDSHRAEPEAMDPEVAAYLERPGGRRIRLGHGHKEYVRRQPMTPGDIISFFAIISHLWRF